MIPRTEDELDLAVRACRRLSTRAGLKSAAVGALPVPLLRKLGIRIATRQGAKYIPLIGTAIAAGVSFGAVKLLANMHIRECEQIVRKLLAEQRSGRNAR